MTLVTVISYQLSVISKSVKKGNSDQLPITHYQLPITTHYSLLTLVNHSPLPKSRESPHSTAQSSVSISTLLGVGIIGDRNLD